VSTTPIPRCPHCDVEFYECETDAYGLCVQRPAENEPLEEAA
jgi:hypothetical protein